MKNTYVLILLDGVFEEDEDEVVSSCSAFRFFLF
jgi:hypothetical protein